MSTARQGGQNRGASTGVSPTRYRTKRLFDLTVLTVVHLLLLPVWTLLWIVIPMAIWLEDRGPIFYTQRRLGKDGKVFGVIKFRSMIVAAEEGSGPVWAKEDDPRMTRVGRLLRRRALDELPQVINLWKGDISLVGPRPERPELAERFMCEAPDFAQRLQGRPGLTGLAQVYGRYASRPRDKLRYDLLYFKKMSWHLDLKLLFLSMMLTLRGKW